jgi:hypothetical protein
MRDEGDGATRMAAGKAGHEAANAGAQGPQRLAPRRAGTLRIPHPPAEAGGVKALAIRRAQPFPASKMQLPQRGVRDQRQLRGEEASGVTTAAQVAGVEMVGTKPPESAAKSPKFVHRRGVQPRIGMPDIPSLLVVDGPPMADEKEPKESSALGRHGRRDTPKGLGKLHPVCFASVRRAALCRGARLLSHGQVFWLLDSPGRSFPRSRAVVRPVRPFQLQRRDRPRFERGSLLSPHRAPVRGVS